MVSLFLHSFAHVRVVSAIHDSTVGVGWGVGGCWKRGLKLKPRLVPQIWELCNVPEPDFNVQVCQTCHRQNLDPLWHPGVSRTRDYPGPSCSSSECENSWGSSVKITFIHVEEVNFRKVLAPIHGLTLTFSGSRSQQGSGLVGTRHPPLWDACRISTLLW